MGRTGIRDVPLGLCWGTISQANLPELIELAARFGFSGIQVTADHYYACREAGLTDAAIRRQLADAGVSVQLIDGIGAGLPGVAAFDPDARSFGEGYDAAACALVAEAIEAPLINLTPYGAEVVPVPEMAEAIAAICRLARTRGATIVIEALPESGIRSLDHSRAVIEACCEDNCAIMFDTWHFARSGGTLADLERIPAGMIGCCQLSDRIEPPPGTPYVPKTGRLLPGEGALQLDAFVGTVVANNPDAPIAVEVFSEELGGLAATAAAARVAGALARWRDG